MRISEQTCFTSLPRLAHESCIKRCSPREKSSVLKSTLVFDSDTTVHDVHTCTVAFSPTVPDQVSYLFLSSVSDTDVRTPREWLKKTIHVILCHKVIIIHQIRNVFISATMRLRCEEYCLKFTECLPLLHVHLCVHQCPLSYMTKRTTFGTLVLGFCFHFHIWQAHRGGPHGRRMGKNCVILPVCVGSSVLQRRSFVGSSLR